MVTTVSHPVQSWNLRPQTKTAKTYEKRSNAVVAKNLAADEAKLAKSGVKNVDLKGDYAKAYLKTIYGAKWTVNDKYTNYNVDYKKLKSLLYE